MCVGVFNTKSMLRVSLLMCVCGCVQYEVYVKSFVTFVYILNSPSLVIIFLRKKTHTHKTI